MPFKFAEHAKTCRTFHLCRHDIDIGQTDQFQMVCYPTNLVCLMSCLCSFLADPLICHVAVTGVYRHNNTHTHTHPFNGPFPGLPRWAGTRKVKPIWILLKQETVSGSGIIWAVCKSAPHSRQTTTPVPHHSVFYRPDALPAAEPTASKRRQI